MKTIITAIILCLGIVTSAQKPETVYSVAKVAKSYEWFVEQAKLWKTETIKDPKNEEAWFNYFKACRMAKIMFRTPTDWTASKWKEGKPFLLEGNEIIKLIDLNVPNTFVANYTKWYNEGSNPENLDYLKKAHELAPTRPEPYDGFVVYYETSGNKNKRVEYNKQWFLLNDISPALLNYNYNVLSGIEPGSILLTGGDNDTFPAWMLQDVFGLSTKTEVLNISLLMIDSYRKKIFERLNIPELEVDSEKGSTPKSSKILLQHILKNQPPNRKIYLSMAIWKGYYKEFESDLYVIGNVLEYSRNNINNIEQLDKNFNTEYLLDYLKFNGFNDISNELINRINVNYMPGLIQLYNHYKNTGNTEKKEKVKKTAFLIASKAGKYWETKANETFQ